MLRFCTTLLASLLAFSLAAHMDYLSQQPVTLLRSTSSYVTLFFKTLQSLLRNVRVLNRTYKVFYLSSPLILRLHFYHLLPCSLHNSLPDHLLCLACTRRTFTLLAFLHAVSSCPNVLMIGPLSLHSLIAVSERLSLSFLYTGWAKVGLQLFEWKVIQ